MLGTPLYINGICGINGAGQPPQQDLVFRCIDPDYKQYLDPSSLRRLGRLQKISLVAAKKCLLSAHLEVPDAIITGTALGCLEDTEKFLTSILENETSIHSPTSFIQSTHNTISGQVAIMLKSNGYNNTFAHRSLAFEKALEDAQLLLAEGDAKHVLVGAVDEMPTNTHRITQGIRLFKSEKNEPFPMAGEGVYFFLISSKESATTQAIIKDYAMIEGAQLPQTIAHKCRTFVESNNLSITDIDAVILGTNGNVPNDNFYQEIEEQLFSASTIVPFKHLSGESFTASAYGVALAAEMIQTNRILDGCLQKETPKKINKILVYNHFQNISHSFFLLEHV